MTTYICASWARIVLRDADLKETQPDFARHLREVLRPIQIAYQKLMSQTKGAPIGVECMHTDGKRWAFIANEVSDASYVFRVQYFDAHGFSGHFCYKTLGDAAEALIKEHYTAIDKGALDRLSMESTWIIGIKRSEIRTLFDRSLITWAEMLERFSAVSV